MAAIFSLGLSHTTISDTHVGIPPHIRYTLVMDRFSKHTHPIHNEKAPNESTGFAQTTLLQPKSCLRERCRIPAMRSHGGGRNLFNPPKTSCSLLPDSIFNRRPSNHYSSCHYLSRHANSRKEKYSLLVSGPLRTPKKSIGTRGSSKTLPKHAAEAPQQFSHRDRLSNHRWAFDPYRLSRARCPPPRSSVSRRHAVVWCQLQTSTFSSTGVLLLHYSEAHLNQRPLCHQYIDVPL